MPTTTNFGWTTPADTDLVKDGAAAIRTLAGNIDTSLVDLKGGTTGQVLAKASNTDLDFTWSADAGIPATIVDAKGDIIAATAADTVSRLAVGSNNQVLTADSSTATGLKWATPASGGKVLQVVSATTTTATTINTATMTDTTLTASITPSLATSKILVLTQQHITTSRSSAYMSQVKGALLRGSTKIVDYSAGAGQGKYIMYIEASGVTAGTHTVVQNYSYLDSPATTSSTTYKTQLALDSTSQSATLTAQVDSVVSSIILMEIGA